MKTTGLQNPSQYQQVYSRGMAAIRAGQEDARRFLADPSSLPRMDLGAFNATSLRGILLRRFLLSAPRTMGVHPLGWLAAAGVLKNPTLQDFLDQLNYWAGARKALTTDQWQRLVRGPVILMYHALGGPGEPASRYVLPARRFARQMAWLSRSGYRVISLAQFLQDRQANRLPPARSVILTFDDGYADLWTGAYPILRRYHLPATVFLVTAAVGGINAWDRDGALAGRPLLTWEQAREMQQNGIAFGAHTQHHPLLTEICPQQAVEEIRGSKADLEKALGTAPGSTAFAYPGGRFSRTLRVAVEEAGFQAACGSHAGINDPATPAFALQRVEIQGTFSMARFLLAVWIGQARGFSRLWRGDGP